MAKAIGTYTIVSLNDGNNAIQMLLSNENHTLPANASGTPTTYAGASTTVTVYDGAKDVTADYTITFTASTGITATKSGNTITITKVTNGTGGTVTIKATKGSNSLTKVFTISLSKAGAAGTSVKVSSKTVTYQLGDSGTTAPTGTWSETVPTLTPKKYLWTKTYIKYSDNTEVTSYSVSYIAKDGTNGTNGKNGNDGRGIASTVITYQASSSGTTTPTGTWQSTIPTVAAGHYLWTKTVINYTSGEPTTSYSVSMMGKTGANGTSISITSKSVTYQIGTSGTTTPTGTWQATVPTLESGKYLWTKTYVKYSDSSETTSYAVSYCAKDGAKGDKGDTGAAGKGISSTTIDYQKSTSGTTVPTGTWSTTIPTVAAKEYLWTRTTIKYTSGSDSVSYSVGMMGATGAAGSSAKLVSVTASSQVFKSTKGANGTFTPEYIYLYPRFQSVSYSKWQYSTNGTTWNNVTSGSNSLTIGTYNSVANSLRIGRNCGLYTKDITAVSFRCISSDASVYDTITIIKVYDVTDIQVGGRNLFLKTKQFTNGNEFWSIHPAWKITQGVDYAEASTSMSGSTTSVWNRLIPHKYFSISDINEHDGATVSFDLKIDDTSVLNHGCICALQIWDATNTRIGWYEQANIITGSGYNKKISDITNGQWTRVSVYFTKNQLKTISTEGKTTDDISYTNVSFQLVRNGSIHIRKVKAEWGNVSTDWTPAPEDVESELIYKSDTDPSDPYEGMLWLNTSTGILYVYTSGQWVSEDKSKYITDSDLENLNNNKNKTWIVKPTPPYRAGDLWVVQDKNDVNYGKIVTCVVSRTSAEAFNISDWIVPLTSYTTVKDMTNVIGTDPSEWSSTSKSLTSLINENTNELEGQKGQMASLAVRASGIEMSFSRTGTMNFLGNSSGQNSVKNWTLSNATKIRAISASDASDINQSLVSLSAFRFDMSGKNLTMTSALFTPPTSDIFTLSTKVKIPGKYTYITFTLNLFSDMKGTTKVGSKVLNVSYAVNAEDTFILHHTSINKKDYSGGVQTAQLVINVVQDTSKYISGNPASHLGKLEDVGKIYFYNSTYTYIKPVYKKINIVEFDSALDSTNLRADVAYKCTKDLPKDSLSDNNYIRGTYYTIMQDALHPKLRPVTDGYNIMMLDSGDYHYITNTGTSENIETSSKQFSFTPGVVYIGDIMINGGQNVQTWTPRQDENLWGDYIKFDYSGITIENVPNGYRRTIDSSSDIAFQIDDSGNIVKCIWKLTQDGFITNDIKCIGTFAMGYVTNDASPDLDSTFKSVMEMKKNQEQTGIDEYLFVNS